MPEERWIFVVKVDDRAGVLTAMASVFSSRGVSLETTLGCGGQAGGGRIVLGFRASERKRDNLFRTISRLSRVKEVKTYPYHSPELRFVAFARIAATERGEFPDASVHTELVAEHPEDKTMLIAGSAAAVEGAVEALRQRGTLLELIQSVIAV